MGIGFFNIPLIGTPSVSRGCFGGGGGSNGGAIPSRGEGPDRCRQKARGINVYEESIAVTATKYINIINAKAVCRYFRI